MGQVFGRSPAGRITDSVDIVLVEDDPTDVRLTRDAFAETDLDHSLHVFGDGDEAAAFLFQEQLPFYPDLVLLDLDLPGRNGRDILEAIRDEPRFARLPVLVLTNSSLEDDITACYELDANAYVTKPTDPDEFVAVVRSIGEFWFANAQLPPRP